MRFSVEVDKYNPVALACCLNNMDNVIPDFAYEWSVRINAGGIDYGIYLNIDVENKEIEICNQPDGDGDDTLDDVFAAIQEM